MKKMHTQKKRKLNLSRNKGHALRPKTTIRSKALATVEAAKEWAAKHGFLKFEIASAKKGSKVKVIVR